jgi:hypothetical protein
MCEDSTDALSRTLCSTFSSVFKAGDNVESIASRSTPYASKIDIGRQSREGKIDELMNTGGYRGVRSRYYCLAYHSLSENLRLLSARRKSGYPHLPQLNGLL